MNRARMMGCWTPCTVLPGMLIRWKQPLSSLPRVGASAVIVPTSGTSPSFSASAPEAARRGSLVTRGIQRGDLLQAIDGPIRALVDQERHAVLVVVAQRLPDVVSLDHHVVQRPGDPLVILRRLLQLQQVDRKAVSQVVQRALPTTVEEIGAHRRVVRGIA